MYEEGPNNLSQTSAVGLYPQGGSPCGVQDMSGNVWDWCLNKYYSQTSIEVDVGNDIRVLRGGSWNYNSEGAGSVYRLGNVPDVQNKGIGFRVL
jgi:formylglycine-generating enzyme required for sulfatase activity